MGTVHHLNRRAFCQKSLVAGATLLGATSFNWLNMLSAQASPEATPDIVMVKNAEPDVLFDRAIAAIGGIARFVQPNQTVVVKPNIGWQKAPETAANTNPILVKRIVEHCIQAGAKTVYVLDNSVYSSSGPQCYTMSGIEDAATSAGAMMVPAHQQSYYHEVEIPNAAKLSKTLVHETILEADVLINVPVLKNHFASQITIAMKNLMGAVWDRNAYHSKGLHECITDFCSYKKPTLNVVDAYAVTMRNGPQNGRAADLDLKKTLLLSPDIVAIDAAATTLFGMDPQKIAHIRMGHERRIGNMNLAELNIKTIEL